MSSVIAPAASCRNTPSPQGIENEAHQLIRRLCDAATHSTRSLIRREILALGVESVPALIDALSSPIAMSRWESVNLLGAIRAPRSAKPVVEFALAEDEVHARWRAFWAVSRFERQPVLRWLRTALRSRRQPRRWRAALMLSESPDIKVGRSQRTGTTCAVSPAHLSSSNNHRLNTLRRLLAAAEQAPQPERGLRRRPSTEARKYCSGRSQKNP